MSAAQFLRTVGDCLFEAFIVGGIGFIILLLAEEAYERWKARK